MKLSRRASMAVLALVVVAGGVWAVIYQRARIEARTPAGMLRRLPAQNAAVLFVDFDSLRRGGILKLLAQSKTAEDPDYLAFVRATGFEYGRDLDLAVVSFGREGEFFVVRGRFDWKKLESYAAAQGGACYKHVCRMPGSTPERRISFLPLDSNLMALAVSTDSFAATRLTEARSGAVQPLELPADPVWLSFPADALKSTGGLPDGTRVFATALASADKILLSLGPQGQQFEARLAVTCRTSEEAGALAGQLQHTTVLLRDMLARENQKPSSADLSGVLTAGVFEQAGRRVLGHWPLPADFLESLAGGKL